MTQEQILQSPEALQAKDERLAIAQKFQKNQKQKLEALISEMEKIDATEDELNPKLHSDMKYFAQATEAIKQAERFSELIRSQENDKLRDQIQKKQAVVDVCDAENRELQQQLDTLLAQVSALVSLDLRID